MSDNKLSVDTIKKLKHVHARMYTTYWKDKTINMYMWCYSTYSIEETFILDYMEISGNYSADRFRIILWHTGIPVFRFGYMVMFGGTMPTQTFGYELLTTMIIIHIYIALSFK